MYSVFIDVGDTCENREYIAGLWAEYNHRVVVRVGDSPMRGKIKRCFFLCMLVMYKDGSG